MLRGIVGVPGAGKTSFAVSLLLEAYAKKDRPIFTNINLKIPYDDYLRPLDIEDFHDFCENELAFFTEFRRLQSDKRKSDPDNFEPDNYDDLLRTSGVLQNYGNALIFWDECQTDFANEDAAYLRFCSYHRHFEGMDVYLITQNFSLIHRKYKAALDKVYFAVSSSKRLFSKTFIIKVFSDSKMYGRDLIETINFTPTKEIFNSYDSGHDKLDKSVFLKKILPVVILVISIYSIWTFLIVPYVFGNSSSETVKDPLTEIQDKPIEKSHVTTLPVLPPPPPLISGSSSSFQNSQSSQNQQARFLIRFQCTQSYCYFSENRFTIPLVSMNRFFEEFNGKILSAEMLNHDISIITASIPSELFQMLEPHKITSRGDSYGTYKQTDNFGGSSMVPINTIPTDSSTFR